jgi:small-conductance mechanosensitive channel
VLAAPTVDLSAIDPTLSAWDIILALIALIVAWIVARVAARGVRSLTRRLDGVAPDVAVLAARVVKTFVIVIGIGVALTILGADMQPILAATILLAVAAALSLRGIAENWAAGIVLQTQRPFNAGDVVDIKGYTGTVLEINGRATVIETLDGAVVHVPNSDTLDNPIVNRSTRSGRRSAIEVKVGRDRIHRDELLATVREVASGAEGVHEDPPVVSVLTGIDDQRTTVQVTFWHDPSESTAVSSNVLTALAQALTDVDPAASVVTLPLPPVVPPATIAPTR